eukprot:CFRG1919T1
MGELGETAVTTSIDCVPQENFDIVKVEEVIETAQTDDAGVVSCKQVDVGATTPTSIAYNSVDETTRKRTREDSEAEASHLDVSFGVSDLISSQVNMKEGNEKRVKADMSTTITSQVNMKERMKVDMSTTTCTPSTATDASMEHSETNVAVLSRRGQTIERSVQKASEVGHNAMIDISTLDDTEATVRKLKEQWGQEKQKEKEETEMKMDEMMVNSELGLKNSIKMLAELGIIPGLKLQVLWDIVSNEGAEDDTDTGAWFDGVLTDQASGDATNKGWPVFNVGYESKDEFPACVRQVCFNPQGELWDVDDETFMEWRRSGEVDECVNQTLSVSEIIANQCAIESEEGGNVHNEALAAFAELPISQQMVMAQKYRSFADTLKTGLQQVVQQKNAECVITEEDIRSILQGLGKEK